MIVTCTRRLTFCAGHRVMGHENKCGHCHGHGYIIELTAVADMSNITDPDKVVSTLQKQEGEGVDHLGRVIDFSVLKAKFDPWFQQYWDHGFILNRADVDLIAVLEAVTASDGSPQKIYLLPYNPTAENLARFVFDILGPRLLDGLPVRINKVVVHETENCKAEVLATSNCN